MSDQVTLTLDPTEFRKFIIVRKQQYADLCSYASVIVLGAEIEPLIQFHFFGGRLNDLVTFNTDRRGKVRMYLAGVKTMFTDKLGPYDSMWVLDKDVVPMPDGVVTPPMGPGAPNNGGTPIALAA